MPRETTRQPPHLHLLEGGLDFEIRERDGAVRVVLSGSLDHDLLRRVKTVTAPRLCRRGRRIVLDGRRLDHVDYRVVAALIDWARDLRVYGHGLYLEGWRPYLKAILALGARPDAPATATETIGPVVARHGTSLA